MADRSVLIAASLLGFSAVFLSRDMHLKDIHLLKYSWVALGASVASSILRPFLDWAHARAESLRGLKFWCVGLANWKRMSVFATFASIVGLLLGVTFLIFFAWTNLDANRTVASACPTPDQAPGVEMEC